MTRTVQRDWPESCFGARNCDELASNFACKFLVPVLVRVSPAYVFLSVILRQSYYHVTISDRFGLYAANWRSSSTYEALDQFVDTRVTAGH